MRFAATDKTRLDTFGRYLAMASAALLVAPAAQAQLYSEAVSGDLSNNRLAPTAIGTLGLGSNVIVGTSIPTGPIVDDHGTHQFLDQDYLTFTVAAGQQLTGLTFLQGTTFVGSDRLLLGIAQGSSVNVDPNFAQGATGLLGWTLVGSSLVGTNVLPALGLSAPPNFAAIPGATGFTGPLGAGTYSLWLQDGDQPVTYSYSLQTALAPVPEPASWIMLLAGFGTMGYAMRRRPSNRVRFA
ncbi:MAG: PEPxxWA-CTERM sorting domain-containing protein [Sphingomonas sp.]